MLYRHMCPLKPLPVDRRGWPVFARQLSTLRVRAGRVLVAARAQHERALIEAVLSECRGRVSGPSGAAAKLGLPRQTLESKIKTLGIPLQRFKTRPGTDAPGTGHTARAGLQRRVLLMYPC